MTEVELIEEKPPRRRETLQLKYSGKGLAVHLPLKRYSALNTEMMLLKYVHLSI